MKPVLPIWAANTLYWLKIAAAVIVPVLVHYGVSQQTHGGARDPGQRVSS